MLALTDEQVHGQGPKLRFSLIGKAGIVSSIGPRALLAITPPIEVLQLLRKPKGL